MTLDPDEIGRHVAALLRAGYAVEVDLRYPGTPVVPVMDFETEARAILGHRAAAALADSGPLDGPDPFAVVTRALDAYEDARRRGPLWPQVDPDTHPTQTREDIAS